MEKIPTAKEFIENYIKENNDSYVDVEDALIEFAKLHVEAALKAKGRAMAEKSYEDSSYSMNELDSFTRNSYPLENIK